VESGSQVLQYRISLGSTFTVLVIVFGNLHNAVLSFHYCSYVQCLCA